MSNRIRQFHRWMAIAFTLVVIANVVAFGMGKPVVWLYYAPLLPLALLMLTGLILVRAAVCHLVARRATYRRKGVNAMASVNFLCGLTHSDI